jgi:hypothetical protein
MKKNLFRNVVIGAFLMASVSASAQINLGNLGKGLSSVLGSELSSVISGSNDVTAETIAGTWSYQEPAVAFESSNLLKQAGGQVASATIVKKLSTQLNKVGITPGKFLITFTTDGKFSVVKNGVVTTSGSYTISGSKITFSYLEGTANIPGYAQLKNDNLSLLFDSSKILSVFSKIGKVASNSTLGTISSLAGSFDGMKTGLSFVKYVAPKTTATTTSKTSKKATTKKKKSTKKRK